MKRNGMLSRVRFLVSILILVVSCNAFAKTESVAGLMTTEASPNASGTARVVMDGKRDEFVRRLEINTRGLTEDVYTVTVFDSTGRSFTLGDFRADDGQGRFGISRRPPDGRAEFILDDSKGLVQPERIVLSASSGVHAMVGTFVAKGTGASGPGEPPSNGRFEYTAGVNPGLATEAGGFATLKGRETRNGGVGQLRLQASGLPPSTTVIVNVNGGDVLGTQTNGNGELAVKLTHRDIDILSVSIISIVDEAGQELASAQF